jgi:hypothetical protein
MKCLVGLGCLIGVFGWTVPAFAGPAEGQFLGYRIGSKYVTTDATRWRFSFLGHVDFEADVPEKPDEIERVQVIATPKSLTIANIYGVSQFDNREQAEAMADKYATIIRVMHRRRCVEREALLPGDKLVMVCGGSYDLRVSVYSPEIAGDRFSVHIGLRPANGTKLDNRFQRLFKDEMKILEREHDQRQLGEAVDGGVLRGLQ